LPRSLNGRLKYATRDAHVLRVRFFSSVTGSWGGPPAGMYLPARRRRSIVMDSAGGARCSLAQEGVSMVIMGWIDGCWVRSEEDVLPSVSRIEGGGFRVLAIKMGEISQKKRPRSKTGPRRLPWSQAKARCTKRTAGRKESSRERRATDCAEMETGAEGAGGEPSVVWGCYASEAQQQARVGQGWPVMNRVKTGCRPVLST
jgi:hypothetical protein